MESVPTIDLSPWYAGDRGPITAAVDEALQE